MSGGYASIVVDNEMVKEPGPNNIFQILLFEFNKIMSIIKFQIKIV